MNTHTVFLALGTNLGDRYSNLEQAITQINRRIGRVSAVSSLYESVPWGFDSPHLFLNGVIRVETRLLPRLVLFISQAIEREMGRIRQSLPSYQDRMIDIDMILYDHLHINTPELILPHPHYREREFVIKPLEEILETKS